jgi:2-dehydropantoate 2-reductase
MSEPGAGRARVAVVGPGAIGLAFAAAVQEAGHADLVLCGRRALAEATVTRDGQEPVAIRGPVRTDPGDAGGRADWVLLAVKAHQTAGAGGWLRALAGPGSVVVALQNGVEQREQVTPLAGGAEVLPATVWCSAEAVAPGRVRVRGATELSVPAGSAGTALAELMAGHAEVTLEADFTTEAWRKLCLNAVSGLMALAGRRAPMFRDPAVAAVAVKLARECVAVGRAQGAVLPDGFAEETVARLAARPDDAGSSILYDREAGRALEWDARNGVIGRLGARHGIPTPVTDVITPLLAAAGGAG